MAGGYILGAAAKKAKAERVWSSLGTPSNSASFYCAEVLSGQVFVGGNFGSYCCYRYNGSWNLADNGISGHTPQTMRIFNSELICGVTSQSTPLYWTGTQWSAFSNSFGEAQYGSVIGASDNLYISGDDYVKFTDIRTGSWSTLYRPRYASLYSPDAHYALVYTSGTYGYFTGVSDVGRACIVQHDGSTYGNRIINFGGYANDDIVYQMVHDGSKLYGVRLNSSWTASDLWDGISGFTDWNDPPSSGYWTSVVLFDGLLYLGTNDGRIYTADPAVRNTFTQVTHGGSGSGWVDLFTPSDGNLYALFSDSGSNDAEVLRYA